MKDYYAVLGLLPDAEDVVIRAAFRALAQRYHPDKYPGDPDYAKSRMAELNEAYRALSDTRRRRQFQEFMDVAADPDITFDEWLRAFVDARKKGY